MTHRFRDTRLSKSGKNGKPTWQHQDDIEHLTIKSTLYTLGSYTPRPKFGPVSFYNQLFSRYKVVNNRKNPNCAVWPQKWPWTLNSQQYPVYTRYIPPRSKFWPVLLYDHSKISHIYTPFYNSPLTTMLNSPIPTPTHTQRKEQRKKFPKIQRFIIHIF